MRKRWHIINEIVQTEKDFFQDLQVLEDCYRLTAVESGLLQEHIETLFRGMTDIMRFSECFHAQLKEAAQNLVYLNKDQLTDCQLDLLRNWDSATRIGGEYLYSVSHNL